MTKLPPDDQQLQKFLRRHRPIPPQATPDLEEQLMSRIAIVRKPVRELQLWAIPSVIAAALLMAWSGYQALIISPDSANLEVFLENNWNYVVGEQPLNLQISNTLENDLMLGMNAIPTN